MKFHANSFEAIAKQSKKHGMEMFQKGDKPHLEAMNKMKETMKTPETMSAWFADKKKEFDAQPEKS